MAAVDSALKLDRLQVYLQRLRLNPPGSDLWADADGTVRGRVLDAEVTSSFEPVRTPAGDEVAAQALADVRPFGARRGQAGEAADRSGTDAGGPAEPSPWQLFGRAPGPDDLVAFDRRCRTLHTLNFFGRHPVSQDLFLRVHERLLTAVADLHGRAFKRVLDSLGVPASRIVIELPPAASAQTALLAHVIANYRLAGFRVAINPQTIDELQRALAVARVDFVRLDARRLGTPDETGIALIDRADLLRSLAPALLVYGVAGADDERAAARIGARLLQRGPGG